MDEDTQKEPPKEHLSIWLPRDVKNWLKRQSRPGMGMSAVAALHLESAKREGRLVTIQTSPPLVQKQP